MATWNFEVVELTCTLISLSSATFIVLSANKHVCICGHHGCIDLVPIVTLLIPSWTFHLGPGVCKDLWKMPFPNQVSDGSWSGQGLLLTSVLVCPIPLALALTKTHSLWQMNPWWPLYLRWTLSRERAEEAGRVNQAHSVHRLKERQNICDLIKAVIHLKGRRQKNKIQRK